MNGLVSQCTLGFVSYRIDVYVKIVPLWSKKGKEKKMILVVLLLPMKRIEKEKKRKIDWLFGSCQ